MSKKASSKKQANAKSKVPFEDVKKTAQKTYKTVCNKATQTTQGVTRQACKTGAWMKNNKKKTIASVIVCVVAMGYAASDN